MTLTVLGQTGSGLPVWENWTLNDRGPQVREHVVPPPGGARTLNLRIAVLKSLPLGHFSGLSLACIHMPFRHEPANRRKLETAALRALSFRNCEHAFAVLPAPCGDWGLMGL